MTLYSAPPPVRYFIQDKPTLLVCWWCTAFAATIILFRVAGRYIRTEKLFMEDKIAFACLIPLLIRMAFVHVVLLWGTNNMVTTGMSDDEIWRREIGSRLVLASRIFYAATLWMLKLTILEFLKRLTLQVWKSSYERLLRLIYWFLLTTFVAVIIADIAECQPISHYWQVVPDPGPQCRQGYAQLITMGIANVITDLTLVVFPIPIILKSQMSLKRKTQLTLLFAMSVVPVVITLYRVPSIIDRQGVQQYRSLWASIEILFATAVGNALVLGSFVRDRGVKKAKWKFGSTTDSMERATSRRGTAIRHWGSDEDLVRELGLGVDRSLRGDSHDQLPRPAPMAFGRKHGGAVDRSWRFPHARADDSEEEDSMLKFPAAARSPHESMMTSRKVSFFDVGGLLEAGTDGDGDGDGDWDGDRGARGHSHERQNSAAEAAIDFSPQAQARKGSSAFLQDVGGLLAPSGPRRYRERERDMGGNWGRGVELQRLDSGRSERSVEPSLSLSPLPQGMVRSPTEVSLKDVGGLLK